MNDEVKKALDAIRAKVRYQAQAQICTLSTADCAAILKLADELEVAQMAELHRLALIDHAAQPREANCAECGDVFDVPSGPDHSRCGSCQ